jgi:hypothetical protein
MDDYVSKPIRAVSLRQVREVWVGPPAGGAAP